MSVNDFCVTEDGRPPVGPLDPGGNFLCVNNPPVLGRLITAGFGLRFVLGFSVNELRLLMLGPVFSGLGTVNVDVTAVDGRRLGVRRETLEGF